jgi:hypothetical protein
MSEYAKFDNAGWMSSSLGRALTPFEARVVEILGIVGGGIYNAPINRHKINWDYGGGVSVVWMNTVATFDFNELTKLVFLCHEARIRCEIESAGPRKLRMSFWQRQPEGPFQKRHPNLDEAVADFRTWLPRSHPIVFGNIEEERACGIK